MKNSYITVTDQFVYLSLFDGMSCFQIALKELGIIPYKYYASEVDKHAIAQTQLNFPNTIQLGDVRTVDVKKLGYINVLAGGSPCQSFSFAGKRKGMATKCDVEIYTLEKYLELKEQGFEFEGQSYLFWEYMRILTDIRKYNPDVLFLLENVEMGAKWERVLSEAIGVYGVHINSALVSAQNRKRIYWTNIRTKQVGLFGELHADIPQPKDEGILLRDVLERDVPEKYYLRDTALTRDFRKKHNYQFIKLDKQLNPKSDQEKASCFTAGAHSGGNHSDMDLICVSMVGRKLDENGTRKDNDPDIKAVQRLEPNLSGKTNCITSVQKDNLIMGCDYRSGEGFRFKNDGKTGALLARARNDESCGQLVKIEQRHHGFNKGGNHFEKSPTVLCSNDWAGNNVLHAESRIRRLTPTEVARLQTVPDWYIWACSDTQIYRMCGNGWTIKVIMHILSFMKNNRNAVTPPAMEMIVERCVESLS